MNFHHIGLFVESLSAGRKHLEGLLINLTWSREFDDPNIHVFIQFGTDESGICYELIAPNGPKNPVDGSLASRRNILNHIAYVTKSFEEDVRRLTENEGCIPIGDATPAVAFDGNRVQFFITQLNIIIELIEEK